MSSNGPIYPPPGTGPRLHADRVDSRGHRAGRTLVEAVVGAARCRSRDLRRRRGNRLSDLGWIGLRGVTERDHRQARPSDDDDLGSGERGHRSSGGDRSPPRRRRRTRPRRRRPRRPKRRRPRLRLTTWSLVHRPGASVIETIPWPWARSLMLVRAGDSRSLEVIDDGTAQVMEANQFNDPPPSGARFSLVTVALGYFGFDDPNSGFDLTIAGVGASARQLDTDCGVTPSPLPVFEDMFSGGVVIGEPLLRDRGGGHRRSAGCTRRSDSTATRCSSTPRRPRRRPNR